MRFLTILPILALTADARADEVDCVCDETTRRFPRSSQSECGRWAPRTVAIGEQTPPGETVVPEPVEAVELVEEPAASPEKISAAPDRTSGVAIENETPPTVRMLWIPRALLLLPKLAFWLAVQPVRGAVYAYEKYDLADRFVDATFTDDRRFGIYPVAVYEGTYGFSVGARLLYKDILGQRERIKLRATWGGEFRHAYGINLRSGKRFGRIALVLDSSYERRSRERFSGIGNGDLLDTPPMPIDPAIDDTAVLSRFSEDLVRNVATIETSITDGLRSRFSGAVMFREFAVSDEDDITMLYDTSKLVGFNDGVRNVYVEHELVYDSRRPASPYATQTIDGTGWLASAHVGVTRGIEDDPSHHYTYGGEVQRYIDLYRGTRILSLRVLVDAIGGVGDVRADNKISFIDLPRLGGSEFLRGYPTGRFRDRAVALGTVEYSWTLGGNNAGAYTFIDVGEPLSSFDDATTVHLDELRVGFGAGVQLYTKNTYLTRLQLAFSRDGDFFLNWVFSPAFGRRERAGRF